MGTVCFLHFPRVCQALPDTYIRNPNVGPLSRRDLPSFPSFRYVKPLSNAVRPPVPALVIKGFVQPLCNLTKPETPSTLKEAALSRWPRGSCQAFASETAGNEVVQLTGLGVQAFRVPGIFFRS